MKKILIVGGVAGGATTAARLRRIDETAKIIMFERGEYISYANCGLPYYIGGTIKEREKLFVQTPESFSKRFNLEVRINSEVLKIDRQNKEIEILDIKNNKKYKEKYDYLVLSPGAEPFKPNIPGLNNDKIFTLRNVPDTDKIKKFINENKPKKGVVIGAGFIGLEMAENLHNLGIYITIVEMADQVMSVLDYEMAAEIHQHLKMKNVEFYLKDGVASFNEENDKIIVKLKSGKEILTDFVILSIGVKPEVKLAKEAGLKIGEYGGIDVNEFLQTNDPYIYALGDAIEFFNPLLNKKIPTYLAGPANKQGRVVADNIVYGNKRKYSGSIGTAIAKVFDLTAGSTGLSEKILKKEKIPYLASITHSSSHAGYYPNALPMTIKILFSPVDGKLLGAQIVGYEGVDKRLDLFATIIKMNGTIYDLEEIEHAYAPPFSSAKDPVNIAGFVAENILNGNLNIIHWYDIEKIDLTNTILIDVRTEEEYKIGNIEKSINIPLDNLRDRLNEIPRDKMIIVYCGVGLRGYLATRILMQNGFDEVYNLSGGYKTYEHATQKQSNEDIFQNDIIEKDDLIYQRTNKSEVSENIAIEIDACGLQCPGPILKLKEEIEKLKEGEKIKIKASDPGFMRDFQSWCKVTGNKMISIESIKGEIVAIAEKSKQEKIKQISKGENLTIIVFSDDLDKALASFVIANGAAAMGKKVTLFFTFWGLNIIKKIEKPYIEKDLIGKMFEMMLPDNSSELNLSKLNFFGLGKIIMKNRMSSKKVDSLEKMIETAIKNNVEMVACQMSMEMMGISKEELLDNVIVGGVASYLEEADKSGINLFI